jgi:hypothetical protein
MKNFFNEDNQIHNFISSSGSGTVISYGSGSGSDFLTSYCSGSGSTSQKVMVPTVPVPVRVPQYCFPLYVFYCGVCEALIKSVYCMWRNQLVC